MQTQKQIRRRIRSVENTQQITKVMQMVSASKLMRTQTQLQSFRPYLTNIEGMLQRVMRNAIQRGDSPWAAAARGPKGKDGGSGQGADISENVFLKPREVKTRAMMVVTSDRGLCGAYNTAVIKEAEKALHEHDKGTWKLICVGKKGQDYFTKGGWNVVHSTTEAKGSVDPPICRKLAELIANGYASSEYDEVWLAHTAFRSAANITPTVSRFLGIVPSSFTEGTSQEPSPSSPSNYIFEPDVGSLLAKLIPEYLHSKLLLTLIESYAAEHGARMIAMRAATDNANDMIDHLTLTMNKARQASITKEIAEIVGTAEAIT